MPNPRKIETINVRYLNAKKPSGKYASIKTPENIMYWAEPHVLEGVQQGQNISVDVETQKWSKGEANVIVRVLDAAPRVSGTQAPEPGPKPMEPMYRTKSAEEGLEMFVRGVMCSVFHGLGQLPDSRTMANMVYHLRQAWTVGFAADLRALPPPASPPVARAAAAEGFKQVGDAIPPQLRQQMQESVGSRDAPF